MRSLTLTHSLTRAGLTRSIRADWTRIVRRARNAGLPAKVGALALDSLPVGVLRLAGESAKVSRGANQRKVLPAVVYIAGAFAHKILCQWSSAGCRFACLGHTTGHLAMTPSRGSQAWKAALLIGAPESYRALARHDLQTLARKAHRLGVTPAMRFDGASDSGFASDVLDDARRLGVMLWDYTKSVGRAWNALTLDGLDITLSYPGDSESAKVGGWQVFSDFVKDGGRVAVVLDVPKGADLPATFRGLPALDGDVTDLQFTRPTGRVVLLRLKGTKSAKSHARRTGFAVDPASA